MIQRVQSIYIILSVAVVFISSFFPFAELDFNGQTLELGAFGWNLENQQLPKELGNYPYFIGYFLSISLGILMLFKFKNRKAQLSLGKANYFVLLITLIYMFLSVSSSTINELSEPIYNVGLYLLVSAIPFVFLANRGIKNDEKLIKSLDRLR